MRKYLPFTIAKNFKHKYVRHLVGDFETCYTSTEKTDVRVWAWGMLDYMTGEYNYGNNINQFLDDILTDKYVYDIGFHNLKFDGNFIIPQLFKRGFRYLNNSEYMDKWRNGDDMTGLFTHNITTMGQWFSIIITKEKQANKSTPAFVHIWDTLKLFPNKLEEIGKQYNITEQKIKVDRDFYERIRPEGHNLTREEYEYLKADCNVLATALRGQLEKYGTIYRTQASKAFTFFKNSCTDEAGNINYKQKYEGIQQWAVPSIEGLEDYEGAIVRYLPKHVREKINASGEKLIDKFEYYIPDYYTWSDIKKAYTGGISYVNPVYQERSVNAPITVIDVNSMYPYCLRTFPIPFGRFTKKEGQPSKKARAWIACARVSFKLKKDTNLPCIQIKEKYGRKWLRESTDYMKYGEEDMFNEDVIFFTSVDFETYQENYDFTVHKWLYYYEYSNFGYKDGRAFIDKYYKQKQEADRKMKEIKKKNPDTYETDSEYIKAKLDRLEAKIMMNSAYGKHGTKYFLYAKDSVYEGEGQPVKFVAETVLSRDPDKEPSHYYCPYAAFVTSYARRMLVSAWNRFDGRALYCDTDSIHFLGTPDEIPQSLEPIIDRTESGQLGLWKVEGTFARGRYIRSKTYIEITEDGETNITCAGATPEIKKLMNWDTFRVGFNAWDIANANGLDYRNYSKLTPKQFPSGVALEPVNFEIKSQKLH